MNEIKFPIQSNKTLIKASLIALVTAVVIFMTVILPSEYGRDPSGVGQLIGLTKLANNASAESELEADKVDLKKSKSQKESDIAFKKNIEFQKDDVSVIVPAGKGIEYKFKMQRYANLTYRWDSNGVPVYFDFHGEPKGDTTGYFESYTIATTDKVEGSMTVPFDGTHGWYWKNKSDEDIIITLSTQGHYQVKGVVN